MKISRLQYITDNAIHAEAACKGGIEWIQLRVKNKGEEEWMKIAESTKGICKKYNAKLIVNDSVKLAKLIGADGVHLGKEDMPPDEARHLLGNNFIIGGTANTFEDIQRLALLKVDYMGLGPFRFTKTKEKLSPVLGLQGYIDLIKECETNNISLPIIAIGGIQLNDIETLLASGVYGVAVSSAISESTDISAAAQMFINKIENNVLCKTAN